jgi:hypothetical protein
LTACGDESQKPVLTKPVLVENKPPKVDLMCAEEPKPPMSVKTDIQMSIWVEAVRKAGADCRSKLTVVRRAYYKD